MDKQKETIKNIVMQVLDQYPEARESQENFISYLCIYLGVTTISELSERRINLISYIRQMQNVQNTLGLFQATENAKKKKAQLEEQDKEYFKQEKAIISNIEAMRNGNDRQCGYWSPLKLLVLYY